MASVSSWLKAFRLRTLPLALSTIFLGSFLAQYRGAFNGAVLTGALVTTLFLQILSNLANDYGDTVHGVDNQGRVGPQRSVQSGEITLPQMRMAVVIFSLLSFVSGVWLLVVATRGLTITYGIILLLIGVAAIAAALKYTIGKKPYGYAGLGDIAVFLFFGITGVLGTYFLHTHHLPATEFLPAMSIGFFSAGVLNLNNLRDRDNDRAHGKNTMVVKLGLPKAQWYHCFLISSGLVCALLYTLLNYTSPWQLTYLLVIPLLIRSIVVVFKTKEPRLLDPELKKLALATLVFSLLFGVGLIL